MDCDFQPIYSGPINIDGVIENEENRELILSHVERIQEDMEKNGIRHRSFPMYFVVDVSIFSFNLCIYCT
jgi:hypothetical protein